MSEKFWKTLFILISILCLVALGTAYAQQKKVGGGDIKFEGKGSSGPVMFSHETHVNQHKAKCTDCHTKIFKMKKDAKITKADQVAGKFCGACHDGKKAFSWATEGDCGKCHKS